MTANVQAIKLVNVAERLEAVTEIFVDLLAVRQELDTQPKGAKHGAVFALSELVRVLALFR